MPAEMIQSEGGTVRSEIHKLTDFKRNETELPHQLKEQIIVPVYNKSDRADCSNYRGVSVLSITYKTSCIQYSPVRFRQNCWGHQHELSLED
jgi:hypothetical protein